MAKDDLEDSKTYVKILRNTYERCSVPLNLCDSHTMFLLDYDLIEEKKKRKELKTSDKWKKKHQWTVDLSIKKNNSVSPVLY